MKRWKLQTIPILIWVFMIYWKFEFCASLNAEGRALLRFREKVEIDPFGALSNWDAGADDPCSWYGVECLDDGRVVALNLGNLCLKGALAPELGKLIHIKNLVLHNNSFYGTIPEEIGDLQNLEVLDFGHNNLSGTIPSELRNILSLEVLVLRSNRFTGYMSPELQELNMLSECQVDGELLSSNRGTVPRNVEDATVRRLLLAVKASSHPAPAPVPAPAPAQSLQLTPKEPPSPKPSPSSPLEVPQAHKKRVASWIIYLSIGGAVSVLITLSATYLICCRASKVVSVMPWTTGLSGQLRKAFVTGVPLLKRSELETACEDFSNIIDTLPGCTLYKGTLSSGVEIAVTSPMITSAKDLSDQHQAYFRKKISVLSKVNHKNFMNLLGYCEQEEPFTRMMVFEYAPNGTLFEHLHVKEAEQLDWATRLRIAMGIVYCLDHMHLRDPPVVLRNLNSSVVYLTEDYAAKISDLEFWKEEKDCELGSDVEGQLSEQEIVYKFGILLLEIISGRLPFSKDDGLLVLWASSYLNGKRPLKGMVDPSLKSFNEEDISGLCMVIRSCTTPEPKERPTMTEVASRMRQITAMAPDGATPKVSPLWWAELEIISS